MSGPLKTMPLELKKRLSGGIIQVYNQTKDLPDKKRPLVFKRELRRWISQQALSFSTEWKASAEEYAGRSLSAVFVQFEMFPRGPGERSARFKVPPLPLTVSSPEATETSVPAGIFIGSLPVRLI